MNGAVRQYLTAAAAVITVVAVIVGGLALYSGMYPPFSVVNSGSMQHSDDSSIGTIDTGDMVIVQSPDKKDIVTYVEGSVSGYSKFGEYGDVIIYQEGNRSIIHRAMLELTLESSSIIHQTWYVPSLTGYDDWDIVDSNGQSIKNILHWNADDGLLTIYATDMSSRLVLMNVGYSDAECSVNLWNLGSKMSDGESGYLTKGDNGETNSNFDQSTGITDSLITDDRIEAIAGIEIPWLGSVKMLVSGNGGDIPANSIVCLSVSIVVIIALIFAISWFFEKRASMKRKDE